MRAKPQTQPVRGVDDPRRADADAMLGRCPLARSQEVLLVRLNATARRSGPAGPDRRYAIVLHDAEPSDKLKAIKHDNLILTDDSVARRRSSTFLC